MCANLFHSQQDRYSQKKSYSHFNHSVMHWFHVTLLLNAAHSSKARSGHDFLRLLKQTSSYFSQFNKTIMSHLPKPSS